MCYSTSLEGFHLQGFTIVSPFFSTKHMQKISSPLKFRDLMDLDLWQSPWEHCALWCPPGVVMDGWNSWKERDGVHEDHRENHFLLMSFFAWRWKMWNDFVVGSCETFLFEWLSKNQSSLENTLRNLSVFWLQSVVWSNLKNMGGKLKWIHNNLELVEVR